jgi:hypothetical protein
MEYFARVAEENTGRFQAGEMQREEYLASQVIE